MMNKRVIFAVLSWTICCFVGLYAQEEELDVEKSAEVFLEQYTDEFQENFFEALKQKGIENYDKAINLLLECKRIDEQSPVVNHELAKVYLADKQYILAQEYGVLALNSAPDNYWYLDTLVGILTKQGLAEKSWNTQLPYENVMLRENLAAIFFKNQKYEAALSVLKDLKKSAFKDQLTNKINDSLGKQVSDKLAVQNTAPLASEKSPYDKYRDEIARLIRSEDYSALKDTASEAIESFPSQPYFYYARGLALNKSAKPNQAVEVLESALDYLLDDSNLADKIYRELAAAYTSLGNTSKANMYLSKIKSGS